MSRVLIVDSDTESAELYATALSVKQHQVTIASNAQEALYAVEKLAPHKIILELDMPGHNGMEFLYEFISYSDWSAVGIIIHSNLRPEIFGRMSVSWQELNVHSYLYKPKTSLSDLQAAI